MAIIVETGSGSDPTANSYATEAELQAYADARGITVAGQTDEDLLKAMDYLETQPFIGRKSTQDQPLQWPRDGVVIDGYSYEASNLPRELKEALLVIAISIDQGLDPLADLAPSVKRKRVKAGSVESETEYQDGAASRQQSVSISRALRKLIRSGGSQLSVMRG